MTTTNSPFAAPHADASENAQSEPITVASGSRTFGALNQLPSGDMYYHIGVHEAQGVRMTMEDTHSFIVDFDSVHGQGYFAVFDGHGNKRVSEWCHSNFHRVLLQTIHTVPPQSNPNFVLKEAFRKADEELAEISENDSCWADSGATAVVALLRYEDPDGTQQSFYRPCPPSKLISQPESSISETNGDSDYDSVKKRISSQSALTPPPSTTNGRKNSTHEIEAEKPLQEPSPGSRRVLYCANAGDARAVICRGGVATRLTRDHKATVAEEVTRIRKAGGIILRGRVLGTLAISRSLGDHARFDTIKMKDFVTGEPYISRTEIEDDHEFCIIACDGLWDVMEDQAAVDMIRNEKDTMEASKILVNWALNNKENMSRDNVTVMVIRFSGPPSRE